MDTLCKGTFYKMNLLEIKDVVGGYGQSSILKGINLKVERGQIVSIIGPNGSGKSTTMKSVFGLVNIHSGQIIFDGEDITKSSTSNIVKNGISFVPQTDNIFPNLSVNENLELGAYNFKGSLKDKLNHVYDFFPSLFKKKDYKAGHLSGGERQMVAIGRVLMLKPKLILLDEPTAGLSPKYIQIIFDVIEKINKSDISILIVEQNAKLALAISDRGYVFSTGKNYMEDTGQNLLNNQNIAELFLGGTASQLNKSEKLKDNI